MMGEGFKGLLSWCKNRGHRREGLTRGGTRLVMGGEWRGLRVC